MEIMVQVYPKIAVVLPRGTSFGPNGATSIDLCVRDIVRNSRYARVTSVHCAAVKEPFPGFDLHFDYGGAGGQFSKALRIALRIRAENNDLTIVHQHLPTAFLLSKTLRHPVLLHAHNFQKIKNGSLSRLLRCIRYAGLAGVIFVSEECRKHFVANFPDVDVPTFVVNNGLELSRWSPAPLRLKQVLVAGRAAPEKGVLEAVVALRESLPKLPGWTALLMLTEAGKHPEYFSQIVNVVKGTNGAISILLNQNHEAVQKATEESEIALVLSKWQEPFGRTAMEAHAGGAALISSGTGGLREVSAEAGFYVDPSNSQAVVEALVRLGNDDKLRRDLVNAGHARVMNMFDISKVSGELDIIYDHILKTRMLSNRL